MSELRKRLMLNAAIMSCDLLINQPSRRKLLNINLAQAMKLRALAIRNLQAYQLAMFDHE